MSTRTPLRPLYPSPTLQNDLPSVRLELQKDLRAFIKKVGPELGEIYTKPDLKWGDLFRMQKVCCACVCRTFSVVQTSLAHNVVSVNIWSRRVQTKIDINLLFVKPAGCRVFIVVA